MLPGTVVNLEPVNLEMSNPDLEFSLVDARWQLLQREAG